MSVAAASGRPTHSRGPEAAPTTLAHDPGEIRSLTGLRLFAAAWVVLFHFQFTHGQLLERVLAPGFAFVTTGAMGVDLFYVLSGFVIAFTYLPRIGVRFSAAASRKFIWARVCRIWPVYAVVTMAFGGWLLFKSWYWDVAEPAYQNVQPTVSFGAWLQQMFMVQIWWRPWHDGASWVGPAWSISAEWLAYVLFPVTALLFWRLRHLPRWLLGAVAVLVMAPEAYLCFTTGSPYFPFSWMSRILTGFTAGVLVYLVVRDIPRTDRVRRIATWLSWVVVALILGGLVFGNWLGAAPEGTERGGLVLVLFPPLVGVLALAGSRGIGRLFATRLAMHGGRISYSLYLIHVPVFEVLWTAMERIGVMHDDGTLATALTPLAFAFVFVLADLLYRLIEEPARRALRRR